MTVSNINTTHSLKNREKYLVRIIPAKHYTQTCTVVQNNIMLYYDIVYNHIVSIK